MEPIRNEAIAREYVEAWDAHDADAIVETFAPGGTYRDPTTAGALTGEAIGDHAADLWSAVPDLAFDVDRLRSTIDEDIVLVQWTMRGTQTESLADLPPTGQAFELPGTDVIEVGADGIASVQGYFDRETLLEGLGHRVDVQPEQIGPATFGTAVRADLGTSAEPGAYSLTYVSYRDDEDRAAVEARVREIIAEMTEMDGAIAAIFATVDGRGYTITAWEDPTDAKRLVREGTHQTAVEEMFERDGLGAAGVTSVWTPERLNGRLLRCTDCLELTYEVEAASCPNCGTALPDAPPYW